MLCQKETGVLPGSEIFFNTVDPLTERLFYYVGCCGHYYCGQGYQVKRHEMNCLLLMLVENGSLRLDYRGRKYAVHPGEIVLLDGAAPHRYDTASYVEFLWLHLAGGNSFDLCEHLTRSCDSVVHGGTGGAVRAAAAIHQLLSQFSTGQAFQDAEQSRLLYNVLCELMPGDSRSVPDADSPARRAAAYMQAHLDGDLRLERVAAEVHVSASHLLRLFRAEFGRSPHEYLIEMRMNRARHLLKTTALPVKAIAAAVGYGSESSFTGAFTERIGVPPGKYRELPLV